jgi:hypothetical protein
MREMVTMPIPITTQNQTSMTCSMPDEHLFEYLGRYTTKSKTSPGLHRRAKMTGARFLSKTSIRSLLIQISNWPHEFGRLSAFFTDLDSNPSSHSKLVSRFIIKFKHRPLDSNRLPGQQHFILQCTAGDLSRRVRRRSVL